MSPTHRPKPSERVNRDVQLIRGALDRLGYVLWKKEFLQYGILPFVDIARLNRAWGRSVETFFDVGANVGQTSRQALEAFRNARVFAFEPHPHTFEELTMQLRNERASLHQIALGEQSGQAKLYVYGNSGDGSLINSLVQNARFPTQFGYSASECIVECTTIDEFCETNGVQTIDVLKIDTEGFDFSVIRGAARMLLERRIGFIYTEFNDLLPKPGMTGGSLLPIADYLAPFGLKYVATYTDFILPADDMFICANALFAYPPASRDDPEQRAGVSSCG
jgi:FkbM family methyltransferase